ncbi:ABC transporter substrate-binding protein [Nocardioides litoris]|uniref:ABC transporter substrate-binding protein n=1 Tax=Nocardioides litoris TaxID=1926648 RepID=UPI0011246BD8|nr:ABC transporter substrate-binding protein [Nocardioides litoris]
MVTPQRRTHAPLVLLVALVLVLTACGSNLDPDQVAEAQGGAGGTGSGGSGLAANGGDPAAVDGSGGTVTDPGTTGGAGTTGGTTGTTGTSGTSGGGATTDGGGGTAPAGGGGGEAPTKPPVDTKGIDCSGFKNGPGVTDSTITIGNSSDIGGPVPGLFATARDATAAFTAYFNASVPDGICGRKLALKMYDSRADAAADQQNYAAACNEVFAMVGSQSAFDLGGAKTAQGCGLPDIRAGAVTFERNACTTCFAAQSVNTNFFENAVPDFIKKTYPGAEKKAAMFYTDAGAAAQNGQSQVRAMEARGMDFKIVQGIGITEFNYAPYVARLKSEGIEAVFFITEYSYSLKMRQAMQQQGYTPRVYMRDPTDYNPQFVQKGGSAVDGTIVYTNYVPYEEKNAESDLYEQWLNQVKPGTPPLFFGTFAWSAARLFVELAAKLGGKLTRESLVAELRKVDDWTAQGMHAPQPVGSKGTGECWRFIQLKGGRWNPVGGTKFTCAGLTRAS